MVGVIRRMNKLSEKLLTVKHGPGAAVLPTEVARIHLEFAHKLNDGHMGPRKFWRQNLRRLKYWNPAIPMVVNRTHDQKGPATLSIYFREPGAPIQQDTPMPSSSNDGDAKAPPAADGERLVTINMKNRRSDEILKDFLTKTGAVPVKPTAQEELLMQEIEELKARGEVDRERVSKMVAHEKRERQIRAQAQAEAAAIKAAL
ncbi:CI-B8 domain-containing protein [Podospora fimiseda]|uniref:CI-B8 domain-containing protein n=1 Tax=Podospora fimiseda TaxID=252190 RepID=A0AAN7BSZ2_9PEZI|nr:CI-B8 domain-containing protein [Podospora fimiseda]